MAQEKKKIVVLAGGRSPEHDISLQSAMNVVRFLDSDKYLIHPAMISRNGDWLIMDSPLSVEEQKKFDYKDSFASGKPAPLRGGQFLEVLYEIQPHTVFIMMHGPEGEDGKIQGMLEINGFNFVGPSATSCAVAMDKILTKLIIQQIGLNTPDYTIVHRCDWEQDKGVITDEFITELGLPVFIKSPDLGSSYGLGMADNKQEAIDLADRLFEKAHRIIVEQYIEGIELTVPVLGNSRDGSAEALPVIMIVPKKTRFFDLEAKYDNSITDEITPAPVDDYVRDRCQEEALQIYYALDCDGLSRIDLMWADDKAYWLEVNPIPGFTSASLYPKSAAAHGLDYPRLLDRLIKLSSNR